MRGSLQGKRKGGGKVFRVFDRIEEELFVKATIEKWVKRLFPSNT